MSRKQTPRCCRIKSCTLPVMRGHHFCTPHWFKLPASMRDKIIDAYTRRDKLTVCKMAIDGAALIEGSKA